MKKRLSIFNVELMHLLLKFLIFIKEIGKLIENWITIRQGCYQVARRNLSVK